MQKVTKTIVIDASVEQTFAYISETSNLVDIWPSMEQVKDIEVLPNGGKRFRWVYKMAGFSLKGQSEDAEWVSNERIVSKTLGGINSTITWQFRDKEGKTELAFEAQYVVPVPLLGKLAEVILVKLNQQEIEVMLAFLKARVEWVSKSSQ